ncbi:hypothetical protein HIJ85_12985 [Cronobacter sakazakii]|nr:hypothetical protein [Cronobacter sakazakii]ELY4122433.1 hypothetical protein [Cronobacter sakazakii]ELY5994529.1 hypothetical protein [Cronobacter sakazakii]KAB0897678.1 hypothetical protein FZH99_02350 [Cronobacter sakazakii]KAB0964833.1 hypothetical protein FZI52_02355 [Cronobacter sakazakii]
MHQFYELAYRCTGFTLTMLDEIHKKVELEMSEMATTRQVKTLQALNLQKVIQAVGVFSIFEAHLQRGLQCKNGFKEAELILQQAGQYTLKDNFHNCYLAVNALKHGDGPSYARLVSKINALPFIVDTPSKPAFDEGDVSGVSGLIKADESFIKYCFEIINDVSECIAQHRPNFIV